MGIVCVDVGVGDSKGGGKLHPKKKSKLDYLGRKIIIFFNYMNISLSQ